MRQIIRRFFLIFIICTTLIGIYGCKATAPSSSGGNQNSGPSDSSTETASQQTPDPNGTSTSDKADSSNSGASQAVECNWALDISDTKTTQINGYNFKCTLTISAVKTGGMDEFGTYNGTVTLSYEYDMEKGAVSGNAKGSGQDSSAVFDVIVYDVEKYSDTDGPSPLAPLIAYDAMATGSLNFTGSGLSTESVSGGSWSTSDSKTVAAPYRMAVDGGQVIIELLSIAPGIQFSGMLTGTPIG